MKNEIKQCLNKLFKAKEQVENLQNNIVGVDVSLLFADIMPDDIIYHITALIKHLKKTNTNIRYSYIISKVTEKWDYAWNYYVKLFVYANDYIFKQDTVDNYIRENGLVTDYNVEFILDKQAIVDCINKHIEKFNYEEYATFDNDFDFIQIDEV